MGCLKSLAGWTFEFEDYYELNITMYLDSPYLQKLADIVDPYCMIFLNSLIRFYFDFSAYFDRYANVKLFQLQGADDEFFLPDSEVL
jgi:PhoPQ-activated pathogenicity-related protein